MRGDSSLKPPTVRPEVSQTMAKKRVLFVCIGNSCRSQMAEAFARAYGSDVLTAHSAGLAPAGAIAALTRHMLAAKNVSSEGQFPKGLDAFAGQAFDLVVNLSGEPLRPAVTAARMLDWRVRDPIGQSESIYQAVAAEIESLVMRLILELRESLRKN